MCFVLYVTVEVKRVEASLRNIGETGDIYTRLTIQIQILDQDMRKQDGIHLSSIHMAGLSGIQIAFAI